MTKVEEIHAAVDKAAETLLVDMPYDSARAKQLQAIGFAKSENVQDFTDHRDNHTHAVYYRKKYPHHKFITRHQLEKISKKYNLITGGLQIFKGDIPQRNIDEMLNFRIFRDDIDPNGGQPDRSILGSSFLDLYQEMYLQIPGTLVGMRDTGIRRRANSYGPPSWQAPFQTSAEDIHRAKESRMVSLADITAETPRACSITADKELFEQPARDLDPIVTVAVKGGYLVVTAWGTEASDPEIVNQNLN